MVEESRRVISSVDMTTSFLSLQQPNELSAAQQVDFCSRGAQFVGFGVQHDDCFGAPQDGFGSLFAFVAGPGEQQELVSFVSLGFVDEQHELDKSGFVQLVEEELVSLGRAVVVCIGGE